MKVASMVGTIVMALGVPSHAVLLFSNIGSTDGAQSTIGDSIGSGKALNIVMSAGDDYNLTTATLTLKGVGAGELEAMNLAIWSDNGTASSIDTKLVDLSYSGNSSGDNYEFTPDSAFTLVGGTTYWLAFAAFDASSGHSIGWDSWTEPASEPVASNTAGLFRQNNGTGQSGYDPSTWGGSSGLANSMEINGSVVPEPSVVGLVGLGAAFMLLRRRKA